MPYNKIWKKGLVVGIIVLLVGVSIAASTGNIYRVVCRNTLNYGNLLGYVNDTSGNPIEGALVRVYFHGTYREDYSDGDGFYHVTNIQLCWCMKDVYCSKMGYKTKHILLSIAENTVHDFILSSRGKMLEINWNYGIITCHTSWDNPLSGLSPMPWGKLTCEDLDTGEERFGVTNIVGEHRFLLVPRGHNYRISEHERWYEALDEIICNLGFEDDAYFYLTPVYSITINERNIDYPFILDRFLLLHWLFQRLGLQ